ncbi:(2Fe-2S)-binding protein [Paenibacillus sp. BC26]|uniref:(2Fe-2S)-binding protein n=1 Tax=Paenibacillus sp. BC26 TaxID=1881032 RepID=UPI0008EB2951|nr:(2Fe-2S)-binding protein [Paenibacillus sp. BC26]SFT04620.1 FhuF 2Fe-2S C-terminal domain-containing protein [Paenibacillus sp. BC26]
MEKSEWNTALSTELANSFNIGLQAPESPIISIQLTDLLVESNMTRLLEAHMPLIKTTSLDASAVSVAIGVGNLAFAQQYALSVHGVSIDFSLANVELHLYMQDGYEAFGYTLKQWEERSLPVQGADRETSRQQTLYEIYQATIRPIIEAASHAASIPPRELWGQLPSNLRYYMSVWQESADSEQVRVRLEEDYLYLREGLEPEAFGAKVNPYRADPPLTEDLSEPGRMIPLKNTCCLYFKWEDGEYCFACPRVKESEREARRTACRGA